MHRANMACPVISYRVGRVKGYISKSLVSGSKPVFVYKNVPYGQPPVGTLRFMPPLPATPFNNVLDCTGPTAMPIQTLEITKMMQRMTPSKHIISEDEKLLTEDCLRLSIYTPNTNKEAKLPVMVWFYGGAFQMGFADAFDGTSLCSLHDVVVVVPNYRVGVFGFFSLGKDSPCTGNAGLFDQRLALMWVKDNIENFGGDESNVTIFGESAGGISVNHHVNSPLSRGLFHKAISHSGQATLAKLFKKDLSRARGTLLQLLNIHERDPEKILKKLQTLPASELLEADRNLAMRFMAFNPTLDGKFIVEPPGDSLKKKNFSKVPYMMGCNDSEGHGMLAFSGGMRNIQNGLTEDELRHHSSQFLPRMTPQLKSQCVQACMDFYEGDKHDKYRFSKAFGNIYRDSMFLTPLITTGQAHSETGSPVYLYFATFAPRYNHDKAYGPGIMQKAPWCNCDHGDDLAMMWGVPFNPGFLNGDAHFTQEERELSLDCMRYVTNFAKTGNPNRGSNVKVSWPAFLGTEEYLILNTGNVKPGKDLEPNSVQFWHKTIPEMMNNAKLQHKL